MSTITVAEFIQKHGLKVTITALPEGMDKDGYYYHYRVTITNPANGQRMTTPFHTGEGWGNRDMFPEGPTPRPDHVLDSLVSDASTYEGAPTFEGFCGEFGYDTDSRKAERIFWACESVATRLRRVLGIDAYNELLYSTERL